MGNRAAPTPTGARKIARLMGLARQFVALTLFLTNRQQADARRIDAEGHPRVRRSHHGKLDEVLRPAFNRRARVEEDRRTSARRNRRHECGPIDAR